MVRTKLPPHINGFVDRYGRARYYVRRPGHKNVRLPGLPWSPEFMTAYAEAVEGQQPIKIGEKRTPVGSVAATGVHSLRQFGHLDAAHPPQHSGALPR
jgi:hypothetical protein